MNDIDERVKKERRLKSTTKCTNLQMFPMYSKYFLAWLTMTVFRSDKLDLVDIDLRAQVDSRSVKHQARLIAKTTPTGNGILSARLNPT